jgi:hypothetical protein
MRSGVRRAACTTAPASTFAASATARLAWTAYGDLAFGRLPLQADTLEDAGCTDAALLADSRGPGQHVRGCWAVDLIRGKE